MPRKRKYLKNKTWNTVTTTKYRIGNRKSGVSANSLSTNDLISVIADSNKTKYHKNAFAVLQKRSSKSRRV